MGRLSILSSELSGQPAQSLAQGTSRLAKPSAVTATSSQSAMERYQTFSALVCPFCTRKFNEKAYQRHVDYCKSKAEEKAREERFRSRNSSAQKQNSALGLSETARKPQPSSKIPTLSRSGSSTSFNSNLSSRRDGSNSSRGNIHSKRYDAKQLLKNQQNAGTIKPKQISFKINSESVVNKVDKA